ncbi:hypothetical protein Klosneuvirus_6_87 [Klosneuvirus KNV1]|uniref:Uncharacterized protein n=1 Tax=Klosneuvirus KNV1 TaxID=1977640 RepID=A0A1V0SLB2_9VIRU|nr:hypothetical protein Klosneuvirus_6_87 [Klosneuvirus KNV1]
MPSWFDHFMWIVYIICLNDFLLFLYIFLHPKYHFQLEFNEIGLKFPYWNQDNEPRIYFKMDRRKKFGTYTILILMVYSLYLDNLIMFCSCVIVPILIHIIAFKIIKT